MITSETSAPATPARFSASAIATLPRSWAGRFPNTPLNAPTGVRAAPAMTISFFMFWGSFDRTRLYAVNWACPRRLPPHVYAIGHFRYPWPWGAGVSMRPRDRQACAVSGRLDAPSPLDWLDKTVACASKRAMLVGMGRLSSIRMTHVNGPLNRSLAIERSANRGPCNSSESGTSVTREGLDDVVLTVFSAETAINITRSVLQRTIRGQMHHG